MYILLADDDEDDRFFFEEAVVNSGINFALSMVNDGEELIQKIKNELENLPDLIFLDLNMPRMSGEECLAEIKTHFLNLKTYRS
ncbi:MAG TPA: response regulator [Saprospiraceae bacterium]|nr:response regulator [Saprospiraceae bacterium]